MAKLMDLTGQKFGRLTVESRAEDLTHPNGSRTVRWNCRCDCGNQCSVNSPELRSGQAKSCGCLNKEMTIKRNLTHGLSHTKLWRVWSSMKARCDNPNTDSYCRYGARGITVCEEWKHDFQSFYNWAVSHGYKEGLSIDRINNDCGYSPENCRWATVEDQNCNYRSRNLFFDVGGKKQTVSQLCKLYGENPKTVYARLKRGHSIEEALFRRGQ